MEQPWKQHLLPQERGRVVYIEAQRPLLAAEYRRIRDRCGKRMKKAEAPEPQSIHQEPNDERS